MYKIEQLTAEQEALIPVIRDEWITRALGGDDSIDKEAFVQGIEWLYGLSKLASPFILIVDSPLAAQYAVTYYKEIMQRIGKDGSIKVNQVRDQVEAQVVSQVEAQVWAQVRDQVGAQVVSQVVSQVWDQVVSQVWGQVRVEVGDLAVSQVGIQTRDLVGIQVWDQVEDQVRNQVVSQVRNQLRDQVGDEVLDEVGSQVWSQVRDQVEAQVVSQVWAQVEAQVGIQVRDQVWDQVGVQVVSQVWAQVEAQVGIQVRDQVGDQDFLQFAYLDIGGDSGWASWYEFWNRAGIFAHTEADTYLSYLKSGVFMTIMLDGLVVGCRRPVQVARTATHALHSETGPALSWRDGYKIYAINGVRFPEELFKKVTSGDMPFEDIIAIVDIDQRTQAMRFGDPQKFLKHANSTLLDSYKKFDLNQKKGIVTYELHRIPQGTIFTQDAYFVLYDDPSTGKKYMSGVEPCETVAEAMSWKMSDDTHTVSPKEWELLVPLKTEA